MQNFIRYCGGTLILLSTAFLLQGCPGSKDQDFYLLSGSTRGTWEWVQTITPTHTSISQSIGFTQQLSVGTDNDGAYVAFYHNDTLRRRQNETSRDTAHTFVDESKRTVLIKYGNAGYLKYTIGQSNDGSTMTVSEFLPGPYALDSVKNIYKRVNLTLYPY